MTSQDYHDLIRAVFETPHGRRLLSYLNDKYVRIPLYQPNHTLAEVAFKEGKRRLITEFNKAVVDEKD